MAAKIHISHWANLQTKSDKKPVASGNEEKGNQHRQLDYGPVEKKLYERLTKICPDILFTLNTECGTLKYLQTNKAILEPLPAKIREEEKFDFFRAIKVEDRNKLLEEFENFDANGWDNDFGETEISLFDSEHNEQFFNIRFTPLSLNPGNKVNEWFCQARNITTEKKNLKAIQDSSLKLQMALDGSYMGIWSYDPRNHKMECDERACSMLGLTKEELGESINKIFQRIHPEDRDSAFHIAYNTLRRKGRFNHEIRIILPDLNIIKHIAVVGELITNEKAEVTKVTGICYDITQNKLADTRIKTSETFLEESQRLAKIGGFDWDLVLNKLNMTRELYNILNISGEDNFSLEYFYSRVFQQDLAKVKAAVNGSVKNGRPFIEEFRYKEKNGNWKILWAHSRVERKGEKTSRIIGTIQDVSDKKEKEKELKTQTLLIRSILDHLPVIILGVDKSGVINRLLGQTGLRRLGMVENEKVGKSIKDLFPCALPQLGKVFQGETVNFYQELNLQGRKFHFLCFFFYDPDRELAIGFSIDISAQKEAEAVFQEISAKNKELERVNKLMDMFVYAVAHDLKNPINNLEMLQSLMNEAKEPKEQQNYKEAFQKSIKRLKQTIAGLLEIIGLENSRKSFSQEVDFSDILDNVQVDMQPLLEEKKGKIEVFFHEPKILYNQAFLTSIIKNLLSNAIKYSHPRKPVYIKFETERRGTFILLTIKDNGTGMDLQQIGENIFKPFKRFNRQVEGTGVGLHLVKSMVEKNGGYIEVESKVGEGTCFYCYLKPMRD